MNAKVMFGVVITAVALSAGVGTATANDGNGLKIGRAKPPAPLVGTWQVRVTPYNCLTGVPVPPAFAFDSMLMFNEGGTFLEVTSNRSFLAGQRSPGFGYWERTDRDYYRAVFKAFVQFDTASPVPPLLPYTRGVQTADQGIEMPDDDHFSGDAKVTFRDVNGNVVAPPVPPPGQPVPPGCARFEGTRME
jgi:hypothetical protein